MDKIPLSSARHTRAGTEIREQCDDRHDFLTVLRFRVQRSGLDGLKIRNRPILNLVFSEPAVRFVLNPFNEWILNPLNPLLEPLNP